MRRAAEKNILAAALALCTSFAVAAPPAIHTLDNGTLRAEVTDAIGGRLLSLALPGQPNFLKLDLDAGDPDARVDANSDHVLYYGVDVWAGPQLQWWSHQSVSPARAAARAHWPPDPYLSLTRYTVLQEDRSGITLRGPASPVSGLQLEKRYRLVPGEPNSLRLDAQASNRRAGQVAWDLWINTRAYGDTRVYVPLARREDVRQQAIKTGADVAPLSWTLDGGVFSIDMPAPGTDRLHRNGKLMLQPSGGWIAGFRGGQALLIRFALQPRAAIHPDQGQVELYNDYPADDPGRQGLLEMEVHAPYRHLAPGASMSAAATWTLLPYDGADTRAAHLAFLRAHARALGLAGIGDRR